MVAGLSFDGARVSIEQHVSQQLTGTRVSVTMGNLRSIRVFVLGEAQRPGSYTVSGLSSMTNALFVRGGAKKSVRCATLNLSATANLSRCSICMICFCTGIPALIGSSCQAM